MEVATKGRNGDYNRSHRSVTQILKAIRGQEKAKTVDHNQPFKNTKIYFRQLNQHNICRLSSFSLRV